MITKDEILMNIYRNQCIELQKEKNGYSAKMLELSRQITDIKFNAVREKWGVEIGSIVKEKSSGKLYKLSNIRVTSSDAFDHVLQFPPWVVGFPMKKDGKYSTRKRNIYGDWELLKE